MRTAALLVAAAVAAAGWMSLAAGQQMLLTVGVLVPRASNVSRLSELTVSTNSSSNGSVVVKTTVLTPDLQLERWLAEAAPKVLVNMLACPLPASAMASAPNVTQVHLDAGDCRAAGGEANSSSAEAVVLQSSSRVQALLQLLQQTKPHSVAVAAGAAAADAAAAARLLQDISSHLPSVRLASAAASPQLLLLPRGDNSAAAVPEQQCSSSTVVVAAPTAGKLPNCSLCELAPANITDLADCGDFKEICDFAAGLQSVTVGRKLQLAELLPLLAQLHWQGANQSETASAVQQQLAERQFLTCRSSGERQLHATFAAGSLRLLREIPVSSVLRGRHLTIGFKFAAPFTYPGARTPDGYYVNVTGLTIDMLNEVARRLKFTYRLKQPDDGMWGGTYPNGTWNGMVSEVARGITHMAVGPFTMTYERQTVIEFSTPYMEDGNALMIKKPKMPNSLFTILLPFSGFSWLMVIVSLVVSAASVFILSYVSPFSAWNLKMPEAVKDEISFKENVWNAFGVFMQQGQDYFPLALSARVALATWWLAVVIIYACYMAELVGLFTLDSNSIQTAITGIEGLAEQSTIRPLLEKGTNVHTLFQKAPAGTTYATVNQMMSNMPSINGLAEAKELIMRNSPPYAFISDKSSLSFEALTNCDLLVLPDTFNLATFGWPMPKGAPYAAAINQEIRRLKDAGLMSHWLTKWWRADEICRPVSELSMSTSVIDLSGSAGTYLLFGCFAGAAVVTLLLEFALKRLFRSVRFGKADGK